MKFKDFAKELEILEKINSRNEITEKLAGLLERIDGEEVGLAVYLMLGGLRPKFDSLEFNLAEKQVTKAMARVFDKEEVEVSVLFKKEGDLGELMQKWVKDDGNNENISDVYKRLMMIAKDEGLGSQERKIESLAQLLREMDGLSGKFVVRVVLGKLRLGFSDKTILDAISWMKVGSKSEKKRLEAIYQVRPDVGWIAGEAKKEEIREIKASIELGTPILPMLCQRLKTTEEMVKKMGLVAVEPKFDGTRVQIHFDRDGENWQVRTFTRNLDETSHMFPELAEMGRYVVADSLVLDAEAIGFDVKNGKMLSFQTTITRKRKHGIKDQSVKVPLKFFVFDVIYKDGESLINVDYKNRRKILKQIVKGDELLVVDNYWEMDDPVEIRKKHKELLAKGLEGVIVKKIKSKYVPGRTGWRWVKMKEVEESYAKLADTIDCVVMGFNSGRGKRTKFGVGAFLAGVRDGDKIVTISKVGTGLSDDQFRELKRRLDDLIVVKKPVEYEVEKSLEPDVWVEPGLIVELAADEVTKSPIHTAGVALRFPRLIKFRDDKGLGEITSLSEVKEL